MQATLPVSARLTMPTVLATLIVVAAVAAIAWTVRTATAGSTQRIEQVTAAGVATVRPASYANNVGDALPVFAVPMPTSDAPTQWDNHTWLAVAIDEAGGRWVWAGAWFNCSYVNADRMEYTLSAEFGETWDRRVWAGLAVQQLAVVEVCNAQ